MHLAIDCDGSYWLDGEIIDPKIVLKHGTVYVGTEDSITVSAIKDLYELIIAAKRQKQ